MADLDAIRAELARDVDAGFDALVRCVQDDLFAGVLRLVGDHGRSEDLVQDVFVRAHGALAGYEPERIAALALRPWLWTIALNLVRNDARRATRRPREVAPGEHEPAAVGIAVDDQALASVSDGALVAALDGLPARMRTAVVLRHVSGLTPDEIAQATGRTSEAVRSDVHRGLRRLAAALGEDHGATAGGNG